MVEKLSISPIDKSRWAIVLAGCIVLLGLAGCASDTESSKASDSRPTSEVETSNPVVIPAFQRDSAYAFVAKQVAFGPRNPGSEGIAAFRNWLIAKLEGYGATVYQQEFQARIYTGDTYPSVNIIGSFNPSSKNRILLAAHYDTRFIAEEDEDESMREKPIDGADDGASGVGVLVEIARLLSETPIETGIDLVFFDAEDQGRRGDSQAYVETWCLGAQYWSRNPHIPGYDARFGILLDMVGARNAFFNKENVNGVHTHASQIHQLYNKVWSLANAMGKGRYFQGRSISGIIDDHYFVNRDAGIPMIDIINKPPDSEEGFGVHWHTHNDNLDIIDKNVLGSVGQVVTAVVYRQAAGQF